MKLFAGSVLAACAAALALPALASTSGIVESSPTTTQTIVFSGDILADACTVQINGGADTGSGDASVALPSNTTTNLPAMTGVPASKLQAFTVKLCNCKASSIQTVKYIPKLGTMGLVYSNEDGNNVGVGIFPDSTANSSDYVKFGTDLKTDLKIKSDSTDMSWTHYAALVKVGNGTVSAGHYTANLDLQITYQ